MRAELVRLQCPLQAKVCQHTTEPGRKGSWLGSPPGTLAFTEGKRWACP